MRIGDHNRIEGGFDLSGPVDKNGQLLYRIVGLGRYAENEVDYTTSERRLIAPSFTWRPDLDTTLTVRASYDHDPSSFQPNWLPALGTLQQNPNGQIPRISSLGIRTTIPTTASNRRSATSSSTDSTKSGRCDKTSATCISTVTSKRLSVSSGGPNPLGYAPAASCGGRTNLCLFRTSTHFVEQLDAVTLDNQAQAKFNTGILQHTALVGLDYQWSSANAQSNNLGGPGGAVPNVNYLNPVYGSISDPRLLYSTDQDRSQLGVYAQDQIRLDKWAFVLGVRNDQSKQSTESITIASGVRSAGRQPVRFRLDMARRCHLPLRQRLRPLCELLDLIRADTGYDLHRGSFRPDHRQSTRGRNQVSADVVQRLLHGVGVRHSATECADAGQHTPGHSAVHRRCRFFCQLQAGEVRSQGVELSGKATPVAGLDVVASYSYTDIRITESPQIITGIPLAGKVPSVRRSYRGPVGGLHLPTGFLAWFRFGGGVALYRIVLWRQHQFRRDGGSCLYIGGSGGSL